MSFLNKRGSVLIMVYLVLGVLLLLSSVFFTRTLSNRKLFDIDRERQEAFYLAEAAVDRGIAELDTDWSGSGVPSSAVSLGRGEYRLDVSGGAATKKILAGGYIPQAPSGAVASGSCNSSSSCRAGRTIEAIVKKYTPPSFFDKAIYSADEVDLNGNSYVVNGDVIYANTVSDTDHVTGSVEEDPSIAPLAQLDWSKLREVAAGQTHVDAHGNVKDNVYDASDLREVQRGDDNYPSDFWYHAPSDPSKSPGTDGYDGEPNVVYVEGDMVLNGNVGTIGGFFLVVGDVLTDPTDSSDTSINGVGTVNGSIYSSGNFKINGGAGGINVDGGVWAGQEAELNGNSTVSFNEYYMDAIEFLVESNGAGSVVQILSWREV